MLARAAVLYQADARYEIEQVELDHLGPGEILVRNQACGICHTDLLASSRVPLPAVFGHEGAGVVEAVGAGVTRVQHGDAVIVSYPWCGTCRRCQEGTPYLCAEHMALAFGGTRPDRSTTLRLAERAISGAFFQQSSFAEYSITDERFVVLVRGDHAPERLAALACGIQTGAGSILKTFEIGPLDSVAIFGVGTVGMSAVMASRLAGASRIIAIDIHEDRLVLARELGATHVVDARDGNVSSAIRRVVPPGVDYSLETSGAAQSLEDAITCLVTGGECGMVIAPHLGQKYPFSPTEVFARAANLRGIIQGSAVPATFIPKLLELNAQGRFPYERIIRTYPFEKIDQAIADMRSGTVIKPVLLME